MGQRRKNDGVLPRAFGKERIGELVECKWMYGLCFIIDLEIRKYYTVYQVHHFDTNERYWVDEEDLEKLKLST